MEEYEKQAQDFLDATGTKFSANFVGHDYYFLGDEEKRDIYQITFERNGQKYAFRFGQSIVNSCEDQQKTYYIADMLAFKKKHGGTFRKCFQDYYRKIRIAPTPYDVLACITKADPGSFEDFCSDYGYNTDSKKDTELYLAVQKEYHEVSRMFGDAMEQLQEIS